ncbi:HlyD family efflux transporter periplasmic adaptor subunit [Fischerella sp. PCC 9605]|uniref:HlyD family efflux transporter periplasmic adaptor subunit n=1 Tax=Fischerella sp. PCC 9605 TaxID=1173024 RepID=UPI00047A2BDF|nr:HlyD family efflux transporter periplasmic adaptor subunit [Fischerella sp. PCC 9605]
MSRATEQSTFREQPQALWAIAIALPLTVAAGVLTMAKVEQLKQINEPTVATPVVTSINAIGRLEPRGEVIKLSAPAGVQGTSRVEQLLVKEGERVRKGQVVAVLDNFTSNKAALEEARAKVQEARANWTQVRVGLPKDIQAQKAVIARLAAQLRGESIALRAMINRLEAELQGQQDVLGATIARIQAEQRNALVDARRYEMLYREGAISQQERDRRRLGAVTTTEQLAESQATRRQTIATLQQQLAEARVNRDKTIAILRQQIDEEKARLQRLLEVRPSNLEIVQAQYLNAIAALKRAEAQLRLSYVEAPMAGEILKIYTKAGETMGINGIAEIGRTDQMIVVAEVSEDSIGRVRLGQEATITSDNGAFNGELKGTVAEIGRKVGKKDVLNTDPAADVDARVVEVKIALSPEDSAKVAALTYAKVRTAIKI